MNCILHKSGNSLSYTFVTSILITKNQFQPHFVGKKNSLGSRMFGQNLTPKYLTCVLTFYVHTVIYISVVSNVTRINTCATCSGYFRCFQSFLLSMIQHMANIIFSIMISPNLMLVIRAHYTRFYIVLQTNYNQLVYF